MDPCIFSRKGIYVSALSLALLVGSTVGFTLAEPSSRMRRICPNSFPTARLAPAASTVAAAGGVLRHRNSTMKPAVVLYGSVKAPILKALLELRRVGDTKTGCCVVYLLPVDVRSSEIAPCRQSCLWSIDTPPETPRGNKKGRGRRRRQAGERGGSRRSMVKRKGEEVHGRGTTTTVLRWRLFNLELPIDADPGKNDCGVSRELMAAVLSRLGIEKGEEGDEALVDESNVVVVRKSFDARMRKVNTEPRFCYTVDVRLDPRVARRLRLRVKQGKLEPAPEGGTSSVVFAPRYASPVFESSSGFGAVGSGGGETPIGARPSVAVVGAGPAGLFAALELVEAGIRPIIVERGMPVERRGREIGALFARSILNPESNLCYGEGGAGTWSDGKLTTRIGRNGGGVRKVLETLVAHGAPERILVDGKPHLGTDRLVRILRNMRASLVERGAVFRFDTRVEGFLTRGGGERSAIRGLKLADGGEIPVDRVVLAVGHSARSVYQRLQEAGVRLKAKGIAVGLRVEHPQAKATAALKESGGGFSLGRVQAGGTMNVQDSNEGDQELGYDFDVSEVSDDEAMVDEMMYGREVASMVQRGKGKVPVADYRLTQTLGTLTGEEREKEDEEDGGFDVGRRWGTGEGDRACYSFCMCPGGQVVPTSVDPREVCVNGMSFSKRNSQWANAALVVSLSPQDVADDVSAMEGVAAGNSPLRGVLWQSAMERRAAEMGGGNLVVPVQRVTDFMTGFSAVRGDSLPRSSYRLGVRASPLHELYPSYVTEGLKEALEAFDRRMPGFISDQALLHGVETRTSSPVQVERDPTTLECPTMEGLFPAGEGAGYAGGIVSAAVDGIRVGQSVVQQHALLSKAVSAIS